MEAGFCRWIICGLVLIGLLGLLTIFILFMISKGAGGVASDISGDGNEVTNSASQEISIFHWTSLSERITEQQQTQGYHNGTKYFLISVIIICLVVTIIYKCVTYKDRKRRRRRVTQNLDLIELHHDSLATHGILKNQLTHWRRDEIEKTSEGKEQKRKKEKKEYRKKGKKKGIEDAGEGEEKKQDKIGRQEEREEEGRGRGPAAEARGRRNRSRRRRHKS